ncbi:MAG: phosphopyruvate hydratase [Alphaproteobacteria bacterium]|nr:phosphopyruvate hydratase [Alphaproteobacteria bacterium]
MSAIVSLDAFERFDSRGFPTVAAEAVLESGARGRALAPAGASTGRAEAKERRDGGARFGGRGVREAATAVRGEIFSVLSGMEATDQSLIDAQLLALDGTADKSRLGANVVLAVSLAVARAAANESGQPLYRYLGGSAARVLPVPMFNLINGGAHANNSLDFQEFMILPAGYGSFAEAFEAGAEVYHALRSALADSGRSVALGDEGGFAPDFDDSEQAIEAILGACETAGVAVGKEVWLGLDCAASGLVTGEADGAAIYRYGGRDFGGAEWVEHLGGLVGRYPILSLEDPAGESDELTWREVTREFGDKLQLVGDDNLVTSSERVRVAARDGVGNVVLVKPNQVGTLTETLETVRVAGEVGFGCVVSHRSGETEDTTIADLAVGLNVGQIKCGAPARGERTAKYNRLLDIGDELGVGCLYAGTSAFKTLSID